MVLFLWIVGGVLVFLAVAFALLYLYMGITGKGALTLPAGPRPISEKVTLDIGSAPQKMFIIGQDETKPVLLFLHGGPCSPEMTALMREPLGSGLTSRFVLCHWDQRGCGMSYQSEEDRTAFTLDMLVEDTLEITRYLRTRFGQDKIYLCGHSFGTVLGVMALRRHPEYYKAYMGIGQVTDSERSEMLSLEYFLAQAKLLRNFRLITRLENEKKRAPECFTDPAYLSQVRGPNLNRFRVGLARNHPHKLFAQMAFDFFSFEGYTANEKIGAIAAMTRPYLIAEVLRAKPFGEDFSFPLPFYIFQGRYDYQVSTPLAQEYFEKIQAPHKKFFLVEDAAHCPNMEQPEEFFKALDFMLEADKFDTAAPNWDTPQRAERAQKVAQELRAALAPKSGQSALEFGCGTGLVGLALAEDYDKLVLSDASPAMVEKAREKIAAAGLAHVQAQQLDAESQALPGQFDAVFSSMAVHHMGDVPPLLERLYQGLAPGGRLAIVDLVAEDGSFHAQEPGFTGHNGFVPEEFARQMHQAGFAQCQARVFYQGQREGRPYQLFLASGVKMA